MTLENKIELFKAVLNGIPPEHREGSLATLEAQLSSQACGLSVLLGDSRYTASFAKRAVGDKIYVLARVDVIAHSFTAGIKIDEPQIEDKPPANDTQPTQSSS